MPSTQGRTLAASWTALRGAKAIGEVGAASDKEVPMLLKINTNCNRFWVSPGEPTLRVARELDRIPGIELVGIITHESAMSQPSGPSGQENSVRERFNHVRECSVAQKDRD